MSSFYYTWSRYVCDAFRKDDEIGASLKDSPYKPITLVVCVCVNDPVSGSRKNVSSSTDFSPQWWQKLDLPPAA